MTKSSKRVETEEMDKALEEEYEALCQDEGVEMTILTTSKQDETEFRLGPYFINSSGPHLQHLNKYPFGGGTVLFKTIPPSSFFQPNLKNQKPITSWPLNDSDFNKWYMRLAADKGTTKLWSKAGINRLLALSARIPEPDNQLFKAILCFWCTGSNCFIFRHPIGAMTITLMDLAALTGFRPPSDDDDQTTPGDEFTLSPKSFQTLRQQYHPSDPTSPITRQERAGFIHYWLYKYIHCPTTVSPRPGLSPLSHQIANGNTPPDFLETILASIYHGMHTLTHQLGNGSKPTGSGPLWLIPLWVYAYFPKLWNGPLKVVNPSSYGIYFSKVVPSGKSFSHYFKFFYCMTKVEDFAPFRSRLYGPTSFTNKFTQRPGIGDPRAAAYRRYVLQWKSWISARDLFINIQGGKNTIYAEVYNPHYVARQFGLTQAWPVLLPSSSQLDAPSQRKILTNSDVDGLSRWQRKTMEGISFVCFTPKARSLPSFVLRFQEAFRSNNIIDEDAIPIARRLLNGETAKTGATEGNKGSSGTNAENTDEPQSSHASSAKRPTEMMVGNPPQPAKRPRNHPSSATLQSHEQSHQSDGHLHSLGDDQLDDNEIPPSDAEETHVVTDNEAHSTSSNDTSHEADSPHGNTIVDGSDTEDDAEVSNFPPELTEPLPSIQLGFQQYASKTPLDFSTACVVASSVPTKNLVSQGQDPFSLSLAPTFLGDHDGFSHSQPMSPLLDAARGDYHPTNPDPTPRPDDVLPSLNNMATQANLPPTPFPSILTDSSLGINNSNEQGMANLEYNLEYLAALDNHFLSSVSPATSVPPSVKDALIQIMTFLSLPLEDMLRSFETEWPINAFDLLSSPDLCLPFPGSDNKRKQSLQNSSSNIKTWLDTIKQGNELQGVVSHHDRERGVAYKLMRDMVTKGKDKSNMLKDVSAEEVACRDEVARLEAALIAEQGKMAEILARKNTITLDLNEIMKQARSIQDKEKTLMSVEEITLKKEQVFQTRAANIVNIINLKTIVEDILQSLDA
ncbi:hypothetical protein LINPERHAP2_LOCUS14571 [Linum perenne]